MEERYRFHFPKLTDIKGKKTSEYDPKYNCIAWAFKDTRRNWWPNSEREYWPTKTGAKSPLQAFEEWFALDGWTETNNHEIEDDFDKVALFAKDGCPTPAARLLDSGLWTSKLGQDIDISHQLFELSGPTYGEVLRIYCKSR